METTPTNPRLATPGDPRTPMFSAPIFSATKPAPPPTVPPNLLYAHFAASHLPRARSARARLAPASAFPRLVVQSLAVLRRAFETCWSALVHRARTEKSLRVAETAALGDRRFVAVVEFERQRFLIGTSPSSVTLLASLPEAGSRDAACQDTNRAGTNPRPAQGTADAPNGAKQ